MIVDRLGIHFLKWGVAAGLLLYGACVSPVVRTDGMTAFEQKQYHRAIPLLSASLESATTRKEKGQLAFLVAECYRLNGRDDLSADWYRKAVGYNHGIAALSGLAYALKRNNRYAEARALFKDLGVEIGSPYAYRKEITACTLAEDWLKQVGESGIKLENLAINSAQNDFAPVVMPDQTVVFTSDRIQSKGHAAYGWTGNKFMDLYRYNPAGGSLFSLPPPINTTGNEGTACPGKSQLFFVRAVASSRGQTAWNKIFVAGTTPDGGFGEPLPLPFQQEGFNYLHPALAPDNRTLVFAANLPGGWGQYDLYAVSRDPQSETGWGTPIMLPRNINTPGNELFPSFYGDTLFFSSDELPGMGGLDIFKTFQTEPNTWAPPINLKPPVNSSADDMSYRPISDRQAPSRLGLLSSNRPGGRGGDDLYWVEKAPLPERVAADTATTTAQPRPGTMILHLYAVEKIFAGAENPNTAVLGKKPLAGTEISKNLGTKSEKISTGAEGFAEIVLRENTDYLFTASHPGYLTNSIRFSTRGIANTGKDQVFELEIELDRIFRQVEIILENIYYDFNRYDLRPDAEPTLNLLAAMLIQNPEIRIRLGSHTDCRGNDTYNQVLSQQRAQSVVDYLIGKGIDETRLEAVGFGETQPYVPCDCSKCSENEHQTNRRTTFYVL